MKASKSLPKAIVVDPVMYAKSGDLLLEEGAIDLLKEKILPLATVLTPNLHEACRILNLPSIGSKEEMESAAFALLEKGPQAVILKGGSLTCSELGGKDCLVIKGSSTAYWMEYPCVLTKNLHGSGCTFSAAIASFLAHGEQILPAVFKAKQYISQTIQEGAKYQLGHGNGPVLHFYDAWNPSFFEEAWKNAFPIYEKIKELSFIQKIKNASLPQEAFFSYLEQDCLFLFDRAKAFSLLSSRTLDPHLQKLLEIRAKDSFKKATKLFQQLSPSFQKEPKKMKSCEMYTQEMLRSASEDSLCEALVFLLSCSYIYQEIGEYLQCTSTSSNPYQDWIDQYSNLERRKKVDEWIQMINQMAKPLCKEAKEQLKIVFSKASQFEYDFWDETYNSTCK